MKTLAAVVQLTSGPDLRHNLDRIVTLLDEAARRGATLAVLPENFAFMGEHERDKFAVAEGLDEDGPILTTLRAAAARHKMALVLGGFPEKSSATHVHNTSLYLDGDGRIKAAYRKIHLFDVEIPDGATYHESASVAPGSEPVVVEHGDGVIVGLSVCYDLRFPELYRELGRRGARVLTVPAAFTLHTGRDHWHVLLRARAVENLCYVLAAAQYGRHNAKRVTYGHSLIVDPWGIVLGEVGDHEGVAVAELDFDHQDRLRRELPALQHRRL